MKNKIFFILSGEHPTLPKAEVNAVLEAENFSGEAFELSQRVITCVCDDGEKWIEKVNERSGMCKASGIELFECPFDLSEISKSIKESELEAFLKPKDTFAVRIINFTNKNVNTLWLESTLGDLIIKKIESLKVNLKQPDKTILGVILEDKFLLGIQKHKRLEEIMLDRSPKKRPVRHAATMKPKLARCMVNLSRAIPKKLFLDPFCGVGGLLIEAGLIGCKLIGCDIKLPMVKGALKNLSFFNLNPEGIFQADARKLPFSSVSSIATDPPYGTSTTTLKTPLKDLLRAFLSEALTILDRERFICLASPKEAKIEEIGEKIGFKLIEKHEMYIHRKLTREIVVFKKE
ncbi:MAG: THUMP domain-containing protein [Candidatus Bathyarchaeia archaeon]|nr:hypothetical protein [Candidatus Bathyarchaeota archaeon]